MEKHILTVTKREITGKKVKTLRKQGFIPGNIYGKNIASLAVQVPIKEFELTYSQTGETGLVELQLDGEKRPVLIHNVQLDYLSQEPVHADFYQVNLKEKIKTMVPVELTGEPQAVTEKLGLLLTILTQVEVEALPADLPEHLEIDVTHLGAVDAQVTVADITVPSGVVILTPADETIAKISELVSKEAEEQATAEASASIEAKAETAEGATDAVAPTGEKSDTPKEEAKK